MMILSKYLYDMLNDLVTEGVKEQEEKHCLLMQLLQIIVIYLCADSSLRISPSWGKDAEDW